MYVMLVTDNPVYVNYLRTTHVVVHYMYILKHIITIPFLNYNIM